MTLSLVGLALNPSFHAGQASHTPQVSAGTASKPRPILRGGGQPEVSSTR
ncbi:hypothetical protein SCOCK_150169 [Actinacidiphila cocklensis]|uniref:Uncharacterized protein n=1 Tax=Actinacidiphila cocklensis TaxID=887465 RepID=A0A9W4DL78_9ACTN|nr:hypothetical protein SCOCK_150169 [Actinacidiphila cocklensis]